MDQKDKYYIKDYFKGFKIVEELPLDHTDDDALKETVNRVISAIRERCE